MFSESSFEQEVSSVEASEVQGPAEEPFHRPKTRRGRSRPGTAKPGKEDSKGIRH